MQCAQTAEFTDYSGSEEPPVRRIPEGCRNSGSPVDLVSGAEALLVPLRSLRELQRLVKGSFIRQEPS